MAWLIIGAKSYTPKAFRSLSIYFKVIGIGTLIVRVKVSLPCVFIQF